MNIEHFTERIAADLQTTLPHRYAHVEVNSRNVERIGGSYLGIELKPEGNFGPLLKAGKYYEEYIHGTPYFHVLNLIVNDAVNALDKLPPKLDINLDKLVGTSDMKKIKDLKDRPLLLFVNSWSVRMTLERNEGLVLSEFGRS